MLDPLTIALMLLAGLLHASWHSLVKYGDDQIVVLAGMGLVAAAIAACALPFLPLPQPAVWPVLAGDHSSTTEERLQSEWVRVPAVRSSRTTRWFWES